MFGSNKPQVQTEIKPGPVFDPKTIPAHTMQDDLDILSGKVKTSVVTLSDNKNTISGNDSPKGSPFMQTAAPIPPVAATFTPTPTPVSSFSSVRKEGNQRISGAVNETVNITKEPIKTSNFDRPTGIPVGLPSASARPLEEAPKESNLGKIFGILAGVLIFLGALGGGYYFYMTRYNTPELVLEVPPKETVPEAVPEEIPVVIPEKFSADKPNYLLLDVEEITAEDIQKLFLQKAVEIKEDGKVVPIEFVITDKNNNPIALKIFALLSKITFSPKILSSFTDDFSVFIFMDGENVRLGLSTLPEDSRDILNSMKVEEKLLVKGLSPLFLGETSKSQASAFQDAEYGRMAIRYLNLSAEGSLSVDYFLLNGRLVFATSKNTAWAIMDKMVAETVLVK